VVVRPWSVHQREGGEAGLLGYFARGGRARVLALLEPAAGRDPERSAAHRRAHAKQQHAVLLVDEEDAHCVSEAGTIAHADGR
jgi:hypothetical protein